MYYCQHCGVPIKAEDKFCPSCGKKVIEITAPDTSVPPTIATPEETSAKPEGAPKQEAHKNKPEDNPNPYFLTTIENVVEYGVFVKYDRKTNILCHKSNLAKNVEEYKKGDLIWVREIPSETEKRKNVEETKIVNFIESFYAFLNFFQEGSEVKGRIVKKEDLYILVEVYPEFRASISKYSLQDKTLFDTCEQNTVICARIDTIDKEKRRVYLTQTGMEEADEKYEVLPKTAEDIDISALLYNNYRDATGKDNITNQEIKDIIYKSYAVAYEKDLFLCSDRKDSFTFEVQAETKRGGPLSIGFRKNTKENGKAWFFNFVGSSGKLPAHSLELFAQIQDWDTMVEKLHQGILEGENWNAQGSKKKYFILHQYINYTFYCAKIQNKISYSNSRDFAAFNTGLVNKDYDAIYGCFVAINDKKRAWKLEGFCAAGTNALGKQLNAKLSQKPEKVQYFNSIYDVCFDTTKELEWDKEHILIDNVERIPVDFIKEHCTARVEKDIGFVIQQIKERKNVERNISKLKEYISTHDVFRRSLIARLEESIKVAIKRCEWNYKTAIPIFFHKINGLSLLLPISLFDDHQSADVALVIEKLESGNYQGQTILTLPMAYLDARLICRPNSEWLLADAAEE